MDVAPTIAADSQADFFQAFDRTMDGKTQKPMDYHQFRLTIAEGPYGILWVPDFQMPGMVAFSIWPWARLQPFEDPVREFQRTQQAGGDGHQSPLWG